jgi:hypothetical protein
VKSQRAPPKNSARARRRRNTRRRGGDFGHDGRLDGFDLWRLWIFANEGTNRFSEFKEKETLEKAFPEAEGEGIIEKRFKEFQDRLYYLT